MKIQIIQRAYGCTEFLARPSQLHLGAQNAQGVDQLEFQLPDSWGGCTAALYLRRADGTQLAPVPLDAHHCVTVDRRLTGCTGGQWMLAAVDSSGYTAYTRPGLYDAYPTLPTDGGSQELPPTLYEQFVARVLESASTAANAAQSAAANAARCSTDAANAQTAARQASTSSTAASGCADRAEAAAARAELLAPKEGQVLSVNGKGGAVTLTAQDLGALPRPHQPTAGALVRVLSVNPDTGAILTDTTPPPDLSPSVRSSTLPGPDTPGPVRADPQYGVSVQADGTLTTVPATQEQLEAMTHSYAPLVPALLPYGVKKALTTSRTAAGWTSQEKTEALRGLGVDLEAYYTKTQADAKFGTPYTLPAATADQLGGVKVGDYLDIAPDGTLSGKTLNDKIAAAVAVKSEPRLVWNQTASTPNKWMSHSISIPDGVDYLTLHAGVSHEIQLARGGSTTYIYKATEGAASTFSLPLTFRSDGTLFVKGPYTNMNYSNVVTFYLSGYHYPTLAELVAETQAAQADTEAVAVDQEYRLTLLEAGVDPTIT